MPIIRSAVKKLRQDKKRQSQNESLKKAVKKAVKLFKKKPSAKLFSEMDSLLGKAVKKNIFHANKAARLKSRLSKHIGAKKETVAQVKPTVKKAKTVKKSLKAKKATK